MSHVIKEFVDLKIKCKPCPFCGARPEWVIIPGDDFIMRCSMCHASTKSYKFTPEDAAADWNAGDILNDNFTVIEDLPIDEYLKFGIKTVVFAVDPCYPIEEGCFIWRDAVIETDQIILALETEGDYLTYDEITGYSHEYYNKPLTASDETIRFVKSEWQNDKLVSITFACGDKTVTVSHYVGEYINRKTVCKE